MGSLTANGFALNLSSDGLPSTSDDESKSLFAGGRYYLLPLLSTISPSLYRTLYPIKKKPSHQNGAKNRNKEKKSDMNFDKKKWFSQLITVLIY